MQVRLRREKVALSPVYYTALQSESVQAGPFGGFTLASAPALKDDEPVVAMGSIFGRRVADGYSSTAHGRKQLNAQPAAAGTASEVQDGDSARWGYLRLTSFSQNAAEETQRAIQSLEVRR